MNSPEADTPDANENAVDSFDAQRLFEFTRDVFLVLGCNDVNAEQGARTLNESDLRGIDSHGIARLWIYVKWLRNKLAPPNPDVRTVRETASTALVDGDGGLGIMVAPIANRICIKKACESGTAWVSVRNSNHFGIAGYYTKEASDRDLVGWAMSNATSQVAPARSREAMLGTNPFSVSIPNPGKFPVLIDMATSNVAYGKIEIAKREKQPIPVGWALNDKGEHTTDPFEIGGDTAYAMLPIGSVEDHGVHKGYCLCALTDILSGVLGDAAFGPFGPHFMKPEISPSPLFGKGLGHLFGAFQITAFSDLAEYKQRIEAWIETFRNAQPVSPEFPVLIPGEPEQAAIALRSQRGIPLNQEVVESLEKISKEVGVPL